MTIRMILMTIRMILMTIRTILMTIRMILMTILITIILAKFHLLPTPHNFATFAQDVEIARARKRLAKLVMMMEATGVWHRMITCGDPWSNALMAHAKVWEVQ